MVTGSPCCTQVTTVGSTLRALGSRVPQLDPIRKHPGNPILAWGMPASSSLGGVRGSFGSMTPGTSPTLAGPSRSLKAFSPNRHRAPSRQFKAVRMTSFDVILLGECFATSCS